MTAHASVERDGPILIVTMNRPGKLNAMGQAGSNELEAIWNDFFADESLRVGILTGAGDRAFCVGADLGEYARGEPPAPGPHGYAGLTHRFNRTKPVIAAVNGYALGGGFEIMLACDLAVAAENAQFGLPEPLSGIAALGGGIPRLARKIPHTVAMGVLLTGRRLSAQDALRYGLINELVPKGEALNAALTLARDLLRCAPLALEATMKVANRALDGDPIADIIAWEDTPEVNGVNHSEDSREGARAFFEKRPPVWRGR